MTFARRARHGADVATGTRSMRLAAGESFVSVAPTRSTWSSAWTSGTSIACRSATRCAFAWRRCRSRRSSVASGWWARRRRGQRTASCAIPCERPCPTIRCSIKPGMAAYARVLTEPASVPGACCARPRAAETFVVEDVVVDLTNCVPSVLAALLAVRRRLRTGTSDSPRRAADRAARAAGYHRRPRSPCRAALCRPGVRRARCRGGRAIAPASSIP